MDEIKNSKILFDYKNNNYRPYIIYITILMIICIFIFLFFFKKETYIESTGTIKQNNILESFSSTSSNPVEAIYKKNDDSIEKNEKILKFDTSDLELQLSSKKENKNKLDKKNLYIEKYIDSLNQETNLIDNNDFGYLNNYLSLMASIDNVKLEIEELHKEKKNIQSEKDKATKELDSANSKIEDLSTFKNLVEHETTGTFKTDEIRDKANEYLNFPDKNDDYNQMTINEITSLKNNYISTRDTLKDSIKQLDDNLETNERNEKTKLNSINNLSDSKISELEIETENVNTEIKTIELEINQLETDINDGTITSKYSGIIEYDSQPKIGEVIATGTSIGKVINTSSKDTTIELYVPSSLISEVKKGQKVKFKTDSQNGKDATVIYSTVSNINIQPTTSQNSEDSQSYFIVHCKIDKSNTSYIHGLVGTGNIITGEVTYIKYLFNKFF